jgi:hypothetical protein
VGVNTEREIAILVTPTGLPIVYDVIQGVFFASHVSMLVEKLKALGIPYDGEQKKCRVIFGVASANYYRYAFAAVVAVLAVVLLLIKFWPHRVVHIVVLGGSAARNGARTLGQLLLQPPWWHKRTDTSWRLRCEDAEGGPVDIVVTQDDLRRAPKGLIIGRDPSCDHCLALDGVAKHHAQLVPLGAGLGVTDLNSESGTTVDERPLNPNDSPEPLASGARLRIGNVLFHVERR